QRRGSCPERRSFRFTPTRVGTTIRDDRPHSRLPVHPHARGDNRSKFRWPFSACGSPPRAWGQPGYPSLTPASLRFTPTRVGTTGWHRTSVNARPVHPHARGDNDVVIFGIGHDRGSPPRAWGQLGADRTATRPAG